MSPSYSHMGMYVKTRNRQDWRAGQRGTAGRRLSHLGAKAGAARQNVETDVLLGALEDHHPVFFVDEPCSLKRAHRCDVRSGSDAEDSLQPECPEDPAR